jgi:hypothetical protein
MTDAKRAAGRQKLDEIRTATNLMLQRNSQLREIIVTAAQHAVLLTDVHAAQIRDIETKAREIYNALAQPIEPIEKVIGHGY